MWGKLREVREVREKLEGSKREVRGKLEGSKREVRGKLRDKCPRSYGKWLFLVFHSLIRTSDLSVEGTSARKNKRKRVFLLYFAHLFVPLQYDNEI